MKNNFNYFWKLPRPIMTENIKQMFSKMNDETRDEALLLLKSEFNLESAKFIKKNWIIGGRIPEENQERIVQIFQNLLRVQILRIKEIKVQF
ncbi:hypothetical protein [Maribacter spongiicola]|uniref:hypothetical protein n=1 Tax=Maribacter spongiicola TaxID=1206753 RepID=UPI003F97C342